MIYMAHWDHFGRDERLAGDQIFNGAIDNASGTAALLEIANAFMRMKPPPKRSILFLATTAEEAGRLDTIRFLLRAKCAEISGQRSGRQVGRNGALRPQQTSQPDIDEQYCLHVYHSMSGCCERNAVAIPKVSPRLLVAIVAPKMMMLNIGVFRCFGYGNVLKRPKSFGEGTSRNATQ